MVDDLLISILLITGSSLILIASYGIIKMPDVLCRSHALSKAMTLGASLMLLALWVNFGTADIGLKAALAIVFQFITIPVGGHLFAYYATK